MEKELKIKKCDICGSIVKIIDEKSSDDMTCCGKRLRKLRSNEIDASFEKHVPTYKIKDGKIEVTVNHVMDEDHYIEWIGLVTEETEQYIYLKPGMSTLVTFDKVENGTLYSYCNKHGLWKNEIQNI